MQWFLVVLATVLSGCAQQCRSNQHGKTTLLPVTLRLNWTLYGEHAPFFVARALGFYRDQGLEVEITEGSGSATTVKLVSDDKSQFGYASADAVLKGIELGMPVRIIAVLAQKNPQALVFRADRPLKSLKDMKSRRIGVTSGDANSQLFPALLYALKLEPSDVEQVLLHSPRAKEDALMRGSIDAFLGFYVDQPPRMEFEYKVDLDWLPLADAGINTLSSSLITSHKLLRDNPDLVRSFVRASQMGVQYMRRNPAAAAKILSDNASQIPLELAVQLVKLANELHHTERTSEKPIGWVDERDWADSLQLLKQYTGLNLTSEQARAYTNEFIAEVL